MYEENAIKIAVESLIRITKITAAQQCIFLVDRSSVDKEVKAKLIHAIKQDFQIVS